MPRSWLWVGGGERDDLRDVIAQPPFLGQTRLAPFRIHADNPTHARLHRVITPANWRYGIDNPFHATSPSSPLPRLRHSAAVMNDPGVDEPISNAAQDLEHNPYNSVQKEEEEEEQDFLDPRFVCTVSVSLSC